MDDNARNLRMLLQFLSGRGTARWWPNAGTRLRPFPYLRMGSYPARVDGNARFPGWPGGVYPSGQRSAVMDEPARAYQLYVKVGRRWVPVCTIRAASHPEALRQAIACLEPEHYDKPIRLEQKTERNPPPGRAPAPLDSG